ncbi:MAG: hypothetical protein AB7G11_02615 [Phycisphaerales bacterium]
MGYFSDLDIDIQERAMESLVLDVAPWFMGVLSVFDVMPEAWVVTEYVV